MKQIFSPFLAMIAECLPLLLFTKSSLDSSARLPSLHKKTQLSDYHLAAFHSWPHGKLNQSRVGERRLIGGLVLG